MSDPINIQYLGFQTASEFREYTFAVREAGSKPLQYKLTIMNEAFEAHRARYQDAPEICSRRLHHELEAYANNPPPRTSA
jgi:hypothetical protein